MNLINKNEYTLNDNWVEGKLSSKKSQRYNKSENHSKLMQQKCLNWNHVVS